MKNVEVKTYRYGTINNIEASSIPAGSASNSLNWQTKGDHIELRRGSFILGTILAGVGKVNGFYVAKKSDGTEVIFYAYSTKLMTYNTTTKLFVEVGTDILADEDISFAEYNPLAGSQLWISSPNSGLYKIMVANPTSYSSMYDATKNYKGRIRIKDSRMSLWARKEDKTGLYQSYIDNQIYTTVTGEATASLSGTLAFKAGGAKRTCFGVQITITVGGEVYTDNYNGTLTGSLGGTGTINYTSGAYTLSNAGVGTVNYQWEDSTNKGIVNFTFSGIRVAGEGNVFRQDDGGGDLQNVFSYQNVDFCLHQFKTWELNVGITDTSATNTIFRERVGIVNWRCAVATGDGIYYIDTFEKSSPKFKLLTLAGGSSEIIPVTVTLNFDLDDYLFDQGVMYEFGDLILINCRIKDTDKNDTMLVWNKTWKSIDKLDYACSCYAVYGGTLLAGDSLTNNVWTLFANFDDEDASINNLWIGNETDYGVLNLKKTKRLILQGNIVKSQAYDVYLNLDNSGFIKIGTVDGNGAYVDFGQSVSVGATITGSTTVGGGSSEVIAYNYVKEFRLLTGKYNRILVKYVATGVGYVSISSNIYKDIRVYSNKLASKYRNL